MKNSLWFVALAVAFVFTLTPVRVAAQDEGEAPTKWTKKLPYETKADRCERLDRIERKIDLLGEIITRAEMQRVAKNVELTRERWKRLEMGEQRRTELLQALAEVQKSLAGNNPDVFGAAVLRLNEVFQGGNSVPPWDVYCFTAFATCVESGFPAPLCAVGLFACLAVCPESSMGVPNGEPKSCRDPVSISSDVPVSLVYAEVGVNDACPSVTIGAVQAALIAKGRELCAQGNCDEGACKPEQTTAFSILRQIGTFSTKSGAKKQCWASVVAKYKTDCVCK